MNAARRQLEKAGGYEMRERRNIRGTEDILQYIMVFRRIVCMCAVVFICIVGKECIVQAAEYDYPIEKTKEVQVLDENNMDSQGVKYMLYRDKTAQVGVNYTGIQSNNNLSKYEGANDGVCVIPEKVSKDGTEYEVTRIGTNAFYFNTKLKVLVVPDTVTSVGQYAVSNSTIQYVYLGEGARSDGSPYHFCEYLREITVSEQNTYLMDIDGILYTRDKKKLLMNPACKLGSSGSEYVIPEGVEVVGAYAFAYSKYRKIQLPDSLKTICEFGFDQAGLLTEIDLKQVSYIGEHAFRGCDALYKVVFPDNEYTTCTEIMDGDLLRALFVKKGIKHNSTSHSFYYLKYLNTLAFEAGTTVIGDYDFEKCGQLQTVLIPDTVTTMKSGCFKNCPRLTRLYIPSSVTLIGENAFMGDEITIYGEKGSTAEKYANEKGLAFVDVSDHDHENLPESVVYEDCYSQVIANYCKDCGFASNVRQEWKMIDGVLDGTNGEHDFSLEKTKQQSELDEKQQDGQGVKYYMGESGKCSTYAMDDGIGIANIVIPEIVKYNGRDYVVNALSGETIYNSERVRSIVIPDTVQEIKYKSLSSSTLEYVYIGSGVSDISKYAFDSCKKIKGIWVSPANPRYYVKDHILYALDGTVVYDYTKSAGESGGNNTITTTETREPTVTTTEKTTQIEKTTEKPTEKDTSIDKTTTERGTSAEKSTTEKNTSVEKTTTEKNTGMERPPVTENTTSIENPSPSTTEKDVTVGSANTAGSKNVVQSPTLKVKKKKTSTGQPYLRISLKKIKGTYIELQVKKTKGKFKKVKLISNRLKYYKGELKIGYNPDGKKMWLRIRTYTKKKGKKYYSAWSKPVLVK